MNRNDAESVIRETIEYANSEIRRNKKRSRVIVVITLISSFLIIALLGGSLISYVTFDTGNPFAASSGLFQIKVLDKQYVEIQESPKLILAKPNDELLTEYMSSRGFAELRNEQMGSIRVFTNGETKEFVQYRQNRHCSLWSW